MDIRKTRREQRRRQHITHLQIGLVAVLLLLIAAFKADVRYAPGLDVEARRQEAIEIQNVVPTDPPKANLPPPRPRVPVEVEDDIVLDSPDLEFDAFLGIDEALVPTSLPDLPDGEAGKEEEPLLLAEEMPELIGGLASLAKEIEYPVIAKKAGVEGTVFIQFVVDTDGQVVDAVVLKGIGAGCDVEALRAIGRMRFKPGRQRGKAVAVKMSLPVRFTLK